MATFVFNQSNFCQCDISLKCWLDHKRIISFQILLLGFSHIAITTIQHTEIFGEGLITQKINNIPFNFKIEWISSTYSHASPKDSFFSVVISTDDMIFSVMILYLSIRLINCVLVCSIYQWFAASYLLLLQWVQKTWWRWQEGNFWHKPSTSRDNKWWTFK